MDSPVEIKKRELVTAQFTQSRYHRRYVEKNKMKNKNRVALDDFSLTDDSPGVSLTRSLLISSRVPGTR